MFGIHLPRKLSASARVAWGITAGIALGVALLSAVSYTIFSRQLSAELDQALLRETEAYVAAVQSATDRGADDLREASRAYLSARSNGAEAVLVLWMADGELLSATGEPPAPIRRNITNLGPAGTTRSFAEIEVESETYRLATVPVFDPSGELLAVFQAALPTEPLESTAGDLARALLIAGIAVSAGGGLISRRIAAASLRPLNAAARTAGLVTHASLSQRVEYEGPEEDDVGKLVDTLNRMLDRLEAAFAEQRRFIADASHEMRTPLTIARGHLDVMRAEGGLTEDQGATVDLVLEELKRTSDLVSDLLRLARLEAGGPPPLGPLDLGEVVEEAIVRGQGLGLRRFTFTHGGALPVLGNRDLLLQALLNLISNAVGHTVEGGRIDVVCTEDRPWAEVTVKDDGPGIREDELERVFDRFYRSPGQNRPGGGGGSGLGLAIARRLAEVHQGRLIARNNGTLGAVFVMRIPLLEGPLEHSNSPLTAT